MVSGISSIHIFKYSGFVIKFIKNCVSKKNYDASYIETIGFAWLHDNILIIIRLLRNVCPKSPSRLAQSPRFYAQRQHPPVTHGAGRTPARSADYLFYSSDYGTTFDIKAILKYIAPDADYSCFIPCSSTGEIVYMVQTRSTNKTSIIKSTDRGTTWSLIKKQI
jgi:hypothetical protein